MYTEGLAHMWHTVSSWNIEAAVIFSNLDEWQQKTGVQILLHFFDFGILIKTIQTQSTILEGNLYLPPEASSPFELSKNPKSYVLRSGWSTSQRGPGALEL